MKDSYTMMRMMMRMMMMITKITTINIPVSMVGHGEPDLIVSELVIFIE